LFPHFMLLTFGTIFRDELRLDLEKWSMCETASGKTSIEDRRKKLEERLNRFNQKAQEMIGDNAEEVLDILPPFTGWEESDEDIYENEDRQSNVGEEEESNVGEEEESNVGEEEESNVGEEEESNGDEDKSSDGKDEKSEKPEMTPIWMPSSLNSEDVERLNLKVLAAQELELRKGQASDCLQGLRLALGHRAILYRTKLRHSKTTKGKTRAWGNIKAATIKVNKHVRAYRRARRALEHLGADDSTLAHFQKLETNDLKVNLDVTEENRVGQRNDTLPWFWRLDGQNADQHETWMQECRALFLFFGHDHPY
jgi:hypothetical protein